MMERRHDHNSLMKPYLDAAAAAQQASSKRAIVIKALSDPDVLNGFDQLLLLVESSADDAVVHTLTLFSYGTWQDYASSKEDNYYLTLNDTQQFKLQQLTVLSLLSQHRAVLPYAAVEALPASVESVLISLLYNGTLVGRVCQKSQALHWTECRVGRDVSNNDCVLLETVRRFQQATHQAQAALLQQGADLQARQVEHDQFWKAHGSHAAMASSTNSSTNMDWVHAVASQQQQQQRRSKRSRGGLSNSGKSFLPFTS